jgi:ABC-type phosphate transport system ATPase subunit
VTHNLSQAKRVADDLVFLHQGKIWESGNAVQMFENPCRRETRDYLVRWTEREFV